MIETPALIETAALAGRVLEFTSGRFEGADVLRTWLSADARLEDIVAQYHAEWWNDLMVLLREWRQGKDARQQRDAFGRVMDDPECGMLLANYVRDAYFEPIARRRRMLQHAVVGLLDTSMTLEQLARVWRALDILAPEDVVALYGVWLFPGHEHSGLGEDPRVAYVRRSAAEALEACAAIHVRTTAGMGGGSQKILISRTGDFILRALRTFLWLEQRPAEAMETHSIEGERTEAEARAVLARYPALAEFAPKHVNHTFSSWVMFEGCSRLKQARPTGKSTLALSQCKPGEGETLRARLGVAESDKRGDPVEAIWVERIESWPEIPDREVVTIAGPHDVLRWLAYDLNAYWS